MGFSARKSRRVFISPLLRGDASGHVLLHGVALDVGAEIDKWLANFILKGRGRLLKLLSMHVGILLKTADAFFEAIQLALHGSARLADRLGNGV
jgi:hypothetical protein